MKKLGGLPLSAFVAYSSRKRKNPETTTNTKTLKKKRAAVRTPKIKATESNVAKKVGIKAKLNKKNNKRRKKKLTIGNVAVSQVEPEEIECDATEKEQLDNSPNSKERPVLDEGIKSSPVTSDADANSPNVVWPPTKMREKLPSPKKNTPTLSEGKNGNEGKSEKAKIPKGLNNNPIEEGKLLFQMLIHPVTVENFFKSVFFFDTSIFFFPFFFGFLFNEKY